MDIDDRVGTRGNWALPVEDGEIQITGMYLGCSSSRARRHLARAHPDGPGSPPAPRTREDGSTGPGCSACRWTEFRLFREEKEDKPVDGRPYLLHLTGRSVVAGETTRTRFEELLTAREVIESLTTRRRGAVYLSVPAGRVLAQAAEFDAGALKDAFDARRVA